MGSTYQVAQHAWRTGRILVAVTGSLIMCDHVRHTVQKGCSLMRHKWPLLILLFWLVQRVPHVHGQEGERSFLRVGLEASYFPVPQLAGPGGYVEYAWFFSEKAALVPRVTGASGIERSGILFSHVALMGFSVSMRYKPFSAHVPRLTLDLGPTYGRYTYNDRFSLSVPVELREHVLGVLFSAGLRAFDLRRMGLGLRVTSISGFRQGILRQDVLLAGIFLEVGF